MKTYIGNSTLDYIINLKEEYLEYIFTTKKGKNSYSLSYKDYYLKKVIHKSLFSKRYYLNVYKNGSSDVYLSLPLFKNESQINEILVYSNKRRSILKKYFKEEQLKKLEKQKNQLNRRKLIDLKKEEIKNKKILSVVEEFDKDNNGIIDLIEDKNEFNQLLKKHQKIVIEKGKEFSQNYTHQFIKVGNYIKQKKSNLQLIFDCTKKVTDKKDLDEYVDILEGEIHSYNLLLINSLNLIVSLIEDDQFTFYDIYEKFDKLNIYNSNWENEISQKLTTLNKGISELNSNIQGLMYEIRDMSDRIVSSIDDLSYITEESTRMLDNRLGEIDSSIKTNNLLTLINTYQTYKINKNTKSLRG